jgi:hypothetical protein
VRYSVCIISYDSIDNRYDNRQNWVDTQKKRSTVSAIGRE